MSSSCSSFTIFETDVVCEQGNVSNYRRNLDIIIGDWELFSIEGNCSCGNASSASSTSSGPSTSSSGTLSTSSLSSSSGS